MINPERKLQWRPTSDVTRSLTVTTACEIYIPSSQEDARAYVSELALQIVVDYDGYPDIQAGIIVEEAKRMFPRLFEVELIVDALPTDARATL